MELIKKLEKESEVLKKDLQQHSNELFKMLIIDNEDLFKEQFEIMFKAWVEIVKIMFELTKKTKFDGEMIGYTEELLTFLVRDFLVIPKMPIFCGDVKCEDFNALRSLVYLSVLELEETINPNKIPF
ncbi:hypothetical protein [Helicobacter pylori]|uniref:hypothetical protein n=1 Tax=Helicobacter pylori TaxID=210 RepID=UPI0015DB3075|nr:hypothetical protein [Helicobacter pylori]WRB87966.1 hypothetical protein KVC24_04815 [Helicobacter pylori]